VQEPAYGWLQEQHHHPLNKNANTYYNVGSMSGWSAEKIKLPVQRLYFANLKYT
jgi:hypothetical protein